MKFDQFAYWLQGHFELTDHFSKETLKEAETGKNQFLTATQVECIKNHIQLHLECAQREKAQPEPFICWLDGSLLYFDKLPQSEQESLVLEIKKRLNNLFYHKIDSTMPGDKDSLQKIHDGKSEKKPQGRSKSLERRPGGRGRDLRLMC